MRGIIASYLVIGAVMTGLSQGALLKRCPQESNRPIPSVQLLAAVLAWPVITIVVIDAWSVIGAAPKECPQ